MPGRGLLWVSWSLLAAWLHEGDAFLGRGVIPTARRGSGAKPRQNMDPVMPAVNSVGKKKRGEQVLEVNDGSGGSGTVHFAQKGNFDNFLHMSSGESERPSSSSRSGRRSLNRLLDVFHEIEATTPTEDEESVPTLPCVGDTNAEERDDDEDAERSTWASWGNIWTNTAKDMDTTKEGARGVTMEEELEKIKLRYHLDGLKDAAVFSDAFLRRARRAKAAVGKIAANMGAKKGAEASGNSSPPVFDAQLSDQSKGEGPLKWWWGGLTGRRR